MENSKYNIRTTKEDAEKYFTEEHGPVAKVFLEWKYSLDHSNTPTITLKTLDQMVDVYVRNERNIGFLPHLAPEVDLLQYKILFKELDKFKIQKIRENSLKGNEINHKPKQ